VKHKEQYRDRRQGRADVMEEGRQAQVFLVAGRGIGIYERRTP
jgi:hypothetical protein